MYFSSWIFNNLKAKLRMVSWLVEYSIVFIGLAMVKVIVIMGLYWKLLINWIRELPFNIMGIYSIVGTLDINDLVLVK